MVTDDVRAELLADAIRRYPFRLPRRDESAEDYLRAVIAHIQSHDWAMAYEIRLGRRQADWTADDVAQFKAEVLSLPRPRHTPPRGGVGLRVSDIEPGGMWPVTDLSLRTMLDELMAAALAMRKAKPQADIPIIASVLLMTGQAGLLTVHRGDRIAVLKFLAQNGPVYGYVLVFDAFMHIVSEGAGSRAEKHDAILGHLGTRDGLRLMRRQTYRYVDNRRRIEVDPPIDDIVPNATTTLDDPYAEVFVSVPEPTARPS